MVLSNGYTVDRAAKAARVLHIAANRLQELRGGTKPDGKATTTGSSPTLASRRTSLR